ncbi:uncharacterized protein LOC125945415 [Dermacentor silvarum]|uniref:uncharacterized protein LOC125945415 n=1 Tax=Dermacentor silvarum TaxID=543639 RepID=UPI002101592B|nr:uncharacterized protein LOC125945415 [Dermacentor silvarum]
MIRDDIRDLKQTTNSKFRESTDKLNAIDTKLDNIASTVTKYTSKVDALQETVDSLLLKIDDLENRSRRNNLIIFGVKEAKGVRIPSLERTVSKDILEDLLKLPNVDIERIHRIGRPTENKCRPVILKLLDGRDKFRILKNCGKLRDTEFSISEDFSPRVQSIRKKLWASTKVNRSNGDKVTLVFDKVRINGTLYFWNEAWNELVQSTSQCLRSWDDCT